MDSSQRVAVIGVTGFIGRGLPGLLAAKGFSTTGLSRAGIGEVPGVDRWQPSDRPDFFGHQAVINLAGKPIDRRWTAAAKRQFRESRVDQTRQVVEAISKLPNDQRPKVLVNGSAVGIYGDRGDEILTEESAIGGGYLAELCRDWEAAAWEAEKLGVRVVCVRTGVVLGKGGGAFGKLGTVFKWGVGGKLGSGLQWMSWIHLADLQAAIVHAVISQNLHGPLNGSAPHPERNRDFTSELASAIHRPAVLTVPAFALKLALGEFSSTLLRSQRVIPARLEQDGFGFQFPDLASALRELV